MATIIDSNVTQYDGTANLNKNLTHVFHSEWIDDLTTNDILFTRVYLPYRARIIGFCGLRGTRGDTTGTTTIILYNSNDEAIGTLTFAQADGNNLFANAAINTTYQMLELGEYLYAKVTTDETSDGKNAYLNVFYRFE